MNTVNATNYNKWSVIVMSEKNDTEYLTTLDVAKKLNISLRTTQDLIKRGELPAVRVGRQYRISTDQLARYIIDNSTSPPPVRDNLNSE